jgi:hypothetical protein
MDHHQIIYRVRETAASHHALTIWMIYEHPRDHPDKFVARPSFVADNWTSVSAECLTADSLEEIRALLHEGLVCLTRDEKDDPVIVEKWL